MANSHETGRLLAEWRVLVNMTPRELRHFLVQYGHVAGLSRAEAAAQGIKSGRDSASWILRMKGTHPADWTPTMWDWAQRQVSFIRRMRGVPGAFYKADGSPTRKLLALLLWGHDPEK